MKSAHVLLLTQEDQTTAAVRSVLESRARPIAANVCEHARRNSRTELSRMHDERSRQHRDGRHRSRTPQRMLFELSRITRQPGHLWLIVLSQEFNEKRVLQAMQAGARHFLRKNVIAAELDPVLEQLLAAAAGGYDAAGQICPSSPCSGGCGATTVAVNLANELRLARPSGS